MTPPIFSAVNVPAVQALLKSGSGPLRFYLFGMAPQDVAYPYAVWRQVSGTPENYISDRPDIDSFTLQVEVYANPSQGSAVTRAIASALATAIEGHAHVTAWLGESRDPDTKNYVSRFQLDWWVNRS
ncbi:DUF3168 domain-containing protein, partial [Delftia tsuruhatensis]|uniref:DUF3168 domain-containing protein n=1 Tax=Delftia tsuruhatensis TaxID=180282 RepID=A0ABM6E2Z2_9BURK